MQDTNTRRPELGFNFPDKKQSDAFAQFYLKIKDMETSEFDGLLDLLEKKGGKTINADKIGIVVPTSQLYFLLRGARQFLSDLPNKKEYHIRIRNKPDGGEVDKAISRYWGNC